MELEVKYNPELSEINVLKDVTSLLNQLSECYNSKIKDLENEIACLKVERAAIRKALGDNNIEGLKTYLFVD